MRYGIGLFLIYKERKGYFDMCICTWHPIWMIRSPSFITVALCIITPLLPPGVDICVRIVANNEDVLS